ncbi:MAG: anthranilate phosphoribosyltransferase [Anaerolineales bacterium]|jgi:anthranilate phosphoribosyltransferase
MLKPYLAKVLDRQDLSPEEAEAAMGIIMRGEATDAQIGGYLMALRMKGECVDEITGSARAMRGVASKVPLENGEEPIFDIVGTGGDGAHTFNISTAGAFVIAGTGRKVAKHGNRAASSRCGSADVLGELGVQVDLEPQAVAECIEEIGIGFMFAPRFHPAMKYAIGPRRELGQRSIFNLLGPLTNPADASHLLLGVYDAELTEPIANVLRALGGKAAMVLNGHGGIDELATSGPNKVSHLRNGEVRTYDLDPETLGLPRSDLESLRGGDPPENAQIIRDLFQGIDTGPKRDVLLLNAGAALAVESGDLAAGIEEARQSLDSGKALEKLERFIEFSQKMVKH